MNCPLTRCPICRILSSHPEARFEILARHQRVLWLDPEWYKVFVIIVFCGICEALWEHYLANNRVTTAEAFAWYVQHPLGDTV